MGHHQLRKATNCLNCGRTVENRYCSYCGQENIEPRQPFHYLFTHFFEDFTHYDGKVWQTFKYLLFRPGKLTKEYLIGKRMQFVPPVRLYIFMSFITFLLAAFFSSNHDKKEYSADDRKSITEKISEIEENKKKFAENARKSDGVITSKQVADYNVLMDSVIADLKRGKTGESITETLLDIFTPAGINTVQQLDSLRNNTDRKNRIGWIRYLYSKKEIEINHSGISSKEFSEKVKESLLHNLPKALFLYLPLFAFWLWLLHNKRKWYYYDHGIFTLHFFSFIFLIISLVYICGAFIQLIPNHRVAGVIEDTIAWAASLYTLFYFFRSHSTIYGERKLSSRIKGIFLLFVNLIFMLLFLIVILFISIYTIH